MLEAADAPGGAVRTEELTLPGFQHDTFSSVYPASAASPVFARMPLAEHGLEWVHPDAAYAHPLPGGEAKLLYRDLERDRRAASAAATARTGSSSPSRSWTTSTPCARRCSPASRRSAAR